MDHPSGAREDAALSVPDLGRLLDDATIVVAYSDLLARHARELAPAHSEVLHAIQEAAFRLRSQLVAAGARSWRC